eukprot:CAMPEP_0117769906 /NCGR_PEP_ID=MMETSP0947-20121206/23374_1 /TAXON_ID=44440 /ORGANISM="Chattonella subsalsa, Strain CCMP2191" /LENGTH=80 /DNA_ID=CAMNT_0005594617 /DNA_START=8 /DNA_END=247 /DNA_ORIENTATION=-
MVRNHFTVIGAAAGVKNPKDKMIRRRSSRLLNDLQQRRPSHHKHDLSEGIMMHPVIDGRIHNLQDGAPQVPKTLSAPKVE